ncbi:MAG: hypothetical protein ACO1QS_10390 [Verrucomicrobiota bacterium]
MKTKALLLAGLVSLAGASVSDAQTVYSVNSVGYINLPIPSGFSMIANQLFSSGSTIGELLPTPAVGTKFYKFNGTTFAISEFAGAPFNTWFPDGNATLLPGEGGFLFNPTAPFTLTLTGEVPTGSLSNPLVAGFSIRSSIVPQSGLLSSTLGMPAVPGDKVYKYNGTSYDIYEFAGAPFNTWFPSEPSVNVGEAFFVYKGASTSWDRSFSIASN